MEFAIASLTYSLLLTILLADWTSRIYRLFQDVCDDFVYLTSPNY